MKKSLWMIGSILALATLAASLTGCQAADAGSINTSTENTITVGEPSNRSANLTKLAAASNPDTPQTDGMAVLNGNVQTVTTTLPNGRYQPITVQKGIPVQWTIQAEATDINGCNDEMVSEDFGFQQKLNPGENKVEFTPSKTGTFTYTCWMNMLSSTITVVDDLSKVTAEDQAQITAGSQSTTASCPMSGGRSGGAQGSGCCGGQ